MAYERKFFVGCVVPPASSRATAIDPWSGTPHSSIARAGVEQKSGKSKKVRVNLAPLLAAIKACSEARDVEKGRRIHREIGEEIRDNVYVTSSLVSMYARCGSLVEARRVFDGMGYSRSVVAWTALIMGHVESGHGRVALELFDRMQLEGCSPNARTFVAAIKACARLAEEEEVGDGKARSLRKGAAIHSLLSACGLDSDVFLASCLVEMYAKCGRMTSARLVFDAAPCRDVVLWTCLMLGYADNAEEDLALDCLGRMEAQGCPPNAWTFAVALKACIGLAGREQGTQVDGKIFKVGSLRKGMDVHSRAAASGCDEEKFVASSLVAMYAKCGSMVDAGKVFDRMRQRDVVSWNSLIGGYAENGQGKLALEALERMELECCSPDTGTYVAALKASGSVVAVEAGRRIHAQVCRRGLERDRALATSLVDFYGKCGSMLEAHQAFDSLAPRDAVALTALLAGYSREGDVRSVLELFSGMTAEGLRADGITLVCVLALCSHAGLADKGKEFFEAMSSKYGVTPMLEHYHCMVDILGRSNQLDAAISLVKSTPADSSSLAWLTVLGACTKWRDESGGRVAFGSLKNLGEMDAAACVLMESIYKASRR
ncbi:pentatricopeptide repeat-containing protein At5g27110-like [Selaginella moellendorffii]|uniref:pentatricopeptide repeat-containing protein At5g27110-like n=1 Tax=Selaginella moellendorffii TaxID=88036 RepID=UPI000D1CFEC2|nr:pentatricopeptide repeat-containing protein At5g27110-like [Selaginella moellendorffii]|eukprot:XP_024532132.1 pentatricopeptide repeat-containing protein At5g27110-like [Selaginella moellendorffii]